jgi:hypothetical protein
VRLNRIVVHASLFLLIAGCATTGTLDPTSVPSMDLPPRADWTFNDCKLASTAVTLPSSVNVVDAPPGWNNLPVNGVGYNLIVELMVCQKVNFTRFERGPIHILFEEHTRIHIPPTCVRPNSSEPFLLEQAFVDDAQIAQFLKDAFGVPVKHATFTLAEQNATGSFYSQNWTWAVDGMQPSQLTSLAQGQYAGDYSATRPIAWYDGHVLGIWNNTEVAEAKQVEQFPGTGTMRAPMSYNKLGLEEYVAPAGAYEHATETGPVQLYSDTLCEHPIPGSPPH